MARQYDLLVIDLDGTLLSRNGSVSAANRRALAQAQDAGIELIIATGRALSESQQALSAIGHDGLVVAAGGSLLCEASTGATVDRRVMPHDLVVEVTQWLTHHGHKALVLKDAHATGYDYLAVGENDLDPVSKWWFDQLGLDVRFVDHLSQDEHPEDTVRTGAVACASKLAPLANWLRGHLGDRCFLQHWSAVTATHATGSSTHLLEIFMPDVNKWTMIHGHCERNGIDPARVAAIGDGLNDIELIRNAGLGIAMANACPEVAEIADQTTAHHDEDGVAIAIKNMLAGTW